MPKSSLASVRRVLVSHIMEEEGEDQENVKEDGKEEGQRREESGVVEQSQKNHIMSA